MDISLWLKTPPIYLKFNIFAFFYWIRCQYKSLEWCRFFRWIILFITEIHLERLKRLQSDFICHHRNRHRRCRRQHFIVNALMGKIWLMNVLYDLLILQQHRFYSTAKAIHFSYCWFRVVRKNVPWNTCSTYIFIILMDFHIVFTSPWRHRIQLQIHTHSHTHWILNAWMAVQENVTVDIKCETHFIR